MLWRAYRRADVPALFGFAFKGREEQEGIVWRDRLAVLFVTLDKEAMQEAHRYRDRFVSAGEFQWQSQNRTTQAGKPGQQLRHHAERGIAVHLFVRRKAKVDGTTQPFTYCGELELVRWEGEKPITAWWRLREPLPRWLWGTMGLR